MQGEAVSLVLQREVADAAAAEDAFVAPRYFFEFPVSQLR